MDIRFYYYRDDARHPRITLCNAQDFALLVHADSVDGLPVSMQPMQESKMYESC